MKTFKIGFSTIFRSVFYSILLRNKRKIKGNNEINQDKNTNILYGNPRLKKNHSRGGVFHYSQ